MKLETYCPAYWDKTLSERVTEDRAVHHGPALIFSLTIHSNGDGEADADVYDGESAGGRKQFDLYCADEVMAQLLFPTPVPFMQGIYIDIGTNCEAVTVHYLPVQF